MFKRSLAILMAAGLLTSGCVHGSGDQKDQDPPPEIYANMPLDEALEAGMNHGSETLQQVKRLLKRRGDLEKAGPIMVQAMSDGILAYEDRKLLNASHLYIATPMPEMTNLFIKLVRSGRPLANRIGWRLATLRPSPSMASYIDQELTEALKMNDEDRVLHAEMASAVAANQLKDSYTLLREGLMRTGAEEFVTAMITLSPQQASDDFLDYLALASAEELRQLTLVKVELFSCVAILRHLHRYPADVSHQHFKHLFLYSVSRNRALGELAQTVLDSYVPRHTEHLAAMLASQPGWVQIAFLENARRNMTPKVGLMIAELRNVTAKPDVIDEIKDLNR